MMNRIRSYAESVARSCYGRVGICALSVASAISMTMACQALTNHLGAVNQYFVAATGDDAGPGTKSEPWRTIHYAANMLSPGETLYVRGGIYRERVSVERSGTAKSPIRISAYPGETPVVDGDSYRLPEGAWGALFAVRGDYVSVLGFEVRYSNWMGVTVNGQHCTVSKFNSHHNKENGILITGDFSVVEDSVVWQNCYSNVDGRTTRDGWASGLSAARHPDHATLRRNTVFMNWGEGLSTYEATGTLIEQNIVYDNKTNIYVSDAKDVIVQRNLVFYSVDSAMSYGEHVGIMMGDEKYDPPSANITLINNLLYGNRENIYWWQGTLGGGMVNVLIANNTLANAYGEAGILVHRGPHQDVRILNNIVVQDNEQPVIALYSIGGIVLGNNLWSKSPQEQARAATDVVGDPLLARINFGTAEWFKLQPSSPAIGRGASLAEVTEDYSGAPRGSSPDIGGFEHTEAARIATPKK